MYNLRLGGKRVRKFNFFCSLALVLFMTLLIITLGQNIALRTSAGYTFYFNDTRVVDSLMVNYSNSEMSKEITSFMNSWRPDEFQVYDDTGYDLQDIFSDRDSDNMMAVKKAADISLIVCLISLVITASIYIYFLRNNFKLVLRKRMWVTSALSAVIVIAELILTKTSAGTAWLMNITGLEPLSENSALRILLGGDFISMAGTFLAAYTIIAGAALFYLTRVLTKPPRIFF